MVLLVLSESTAMLHKGTPKEYDELLKTIPYLVEREYNEDMTPKAERRLNKTI